MGCSLRKPDAHGGKWEGGGGGWGDGDRLLGSKVPVVEQALDHDLLRDGGCQVGLHDAKRCSTSGCEAHQVL